MGGPSSISRQPMQAGDTQAVHTPTTLGRASERFSDAHLDPVMAGGGEKVAFKVLLGVAFPPLAIAAFIKEVVAAKKELATIEAGFKAGQQAQFTARKEREAAEARAIGEMTKSCKSDALNAQYSAQNLIVMLKNRSPNNEEMRTDLATIVSYCSSKGKTANDLLTQLPVHGGNESFARACYDIVDELKKPEYSKYAEIDKLSLAFAKLEERGFIKDAMSAIDKMILKPRRT